MTRTRWAGNAWLAATVALTAAAIYTTATVTWWAIFGLWGAGTTLALAWGCYRRAGREEDVARQLAALRATPAAVYRIPPERVEQLRKDTA